MEGFIPNLPPVQIPQILDLGRRPLDLRTQGRPAIRELHARQYRNRHPGTLSCMPSSLKDNRPTRGSVGEFLRSKIVPDTKLSFVSAYLTVNAFDALKSELEEEDERKKPDIFP